MRLAAGQALSASARAAGSAEGLYAALRASRLGGPFAEWVQANEARLLANPRLRMHNEVAGSSAAASKAATPSQLQMALEQDAPVAAAKGAANFSRELQAADLGIKGNIQELRGTFSVKDGVATMRVDMIRGEVQNPLQVVSNMTETAKTSGATTLRIEGTIANERLYNVLERRYGLTSSAAIDSITIPLR